jgi:hypothetical protein
LLENGFSTQNNGFLAETKLKKRPNPKNVQDAPAVSRDDGIAKKGCY